jgi:stage V sporulation protein SpoVS
VSTSGSALAAAVTDAVHEQAIGHGLFGSETSAEQLDLLRDEDGRLPGNVFQQVRQRGRGRPPGSPNKVNRKIAQLVVQKHGDPVLEMASIGFMPLDQAVEAMVAATGHSAMEAKLMELVDITIRRVTELRMSASDAERDSLQELVDSVLQAARRFALKPGDLAEAAWRLKLSALKEVAPYVHGKQPVAIDVTGKADVILNIPGLTDPSHLAELVGQGGLSAEALENLELAQFTEVEADDED